MGKDDSIGSGSGSAFLVNQNGRTYIYSNVHNFDGTKEFHFEFMSGKKILRRDCERVEVADSKYGLYANINDSRFGWGGDVIRIRLKRFQEKALTIDKTILNNTFIGKNIVVTGNTGGRGAITKLEGLITRTSDYDIIHHNAATESGNSGSPILDLQTKKVIGILTWGGFDPLSNPMDIVWSKKPITERDGINSGASLARIKFKTYSFDSTYKDRLLFNRLKKEVRVLGLLDTIYPTKTGLYFDLNRRIMGDYTVKDIVIESPNNYVAWIQLINATFSSLVNC